MTIDVGERDMVIIGPQGVTH